MFFIPLFLPSSINFNFYIENIEIFTSKKSLSLPYSNKNNKIVADRQSIKVFINEYLSIKKLLFRQMVSKRVNANDPHIFSCFPPPH